MLQTVVKNFRWYVLAALAGVCVLIWYAVFFGGGKGLLAVTFFDVGQGDSLFIQAPNGNQVLIDGGPDRSVLSKLARAMPFWDHSLDLVILTHPHSDHVAGLLEVLKQYTVGAVMESGANYPTPEYGEWHRLLHDKHIPVTIARAGEHVLLSPDAELDIFTPFSSFVGKSLQNVHDAMVVSRLVYASSSALLTGDAERALEYQLLFSGAPLKSDVLKIGHHGSKTSTSQDFLTAVAPKSAVISVGAKNRYGHPNQQTLDTLARFGVPVLRTDLDGDIKFVSDGAEFRKVPK